MANGAVELLFSAYNQVAIATLIPSRVLLCKELAQWLFWMKYSFGWCLGVSRSLVRVWCEGAEENSVVVRNFDGNQSSSTYLGTTPLYYFKPQRSHQA